MATPMQVCCSTSITSGDRRINTNTQTLFIYIICKKLTENKISRTLSDKSALLHQSMIRNGKVKTRLTNISHILDYVKCFNLSHSLASFEILHMIA